ncbi:MAG TPA: CBS domain-containing protein [Nitrososphaeraceae archaeon]|nr:CBS domain-containing protein [Nitrososphaeraceae archaeon]
MNAYDVMSVNIVAAKENATAIEIATRIVLGAFNGVPIIDNDGKVIGIVTTIDLLKAMSEGKRLDTMSAKEIMTSNPAVINQDATVDEIIDILYRKRIDMLPVLEEDGRLIGVVSRQDILMEKLNERFVTIDKK